MGAADVAVSSTTRNPSTFPESRKRWPKLPVFQGPIQVVITHTVFHTVVCSRPVDEACASATPNQRAQYVHATLYTYPNALSPCDEPPWIRDGLKRDPCPPHATTYLEIPHHS